MVSNLEQYEKEEQRMELIQTAKNIVRVEEERVKRRMRRLDRTVMSDVYDASIHPSWEKKVRNTAAIASLVQVIALLRSED